MPSPDGSQAYHGAQAQHVGQEMRVLTANLERLDCETLEFTLGYTLELPRPPQRSCYGAGCGQVSGIKKPLDGSNVQSPLRAPGMRGAAFSEPTLKLSISLNHFGCTLSD